MSALVPCPGCNRHVKADETTCPFCQAAVAPGPCNGRCARPAPARLVGLENKKGAIKIGCDADIIIFKRSSSLRVEPQMLYHKHKLTPYTGQILRGVVETTFLRGAKIYERGEFLNEPMGTMLLRGVA